MRYYRAGAVKVEHKFLYGFHASGVGENTMLLRSVLNMEHQQEDEVSTIKFLWVMASGGQSNLLNFTLIYFKHILR